MGTKSRDRMLGYQGPAQPSPTLGDAINAGYIYLEVRCLGCDTHQAVALDIVRRPKSTPVHELERYMRCKDCSEVRCYLFKRSHLVALRTTKISADDPPSTWSPGER
jgi:ribosomal protein S27E